MNQHIRIFIRIFSALALMLVGSDAFAAAAGAIVYGPLPQSIPTLSGSMLIVLALLFSIVAFRVLRAHSASKPLASFVAAGVLALTAASGNQLIHNSYAPPSYSFDIANGGIVALPSGLVPVVNISGVPQQIKSVTGYGCYVPVTTAPPQCTQGLVVQVSNSCNVDLEPVNC